MKPKKPIKKTVKAFAVVVEHDILVQDISRYEIYSDGFVAEDRMYYYRGKYPGTPVFVEDVIISLPNSK